MPRGRAPGYDTQREQILARAAELFARQGYTATSMNQVALACGISKAALYHYVRDKDQLLAEIAEEHVGRLRSIVAQAASASPEAGTRLRALIEGFLGAYATAQAAHRVLTQDVKFLPPAQRHRIRDGQREVVAAFAGAIAQLRPELVGAKLDKPVAMLLFGMMNWMFTWLQPGGVLTHAAMAPVVADLFFGGVGAVRPAGPAHARAAPPASTTDRPPPSQAGHATPRQTTES